MTDDGSQWLPEPYFRPEQRPADAPTRRPSRVADGLEVTLVTLLGTTSRALITCGVIVALAAGLGGIFWGPIGALGYAVATASGLFALLLILMLFQMTLSGGMTEHSVQEVSTSVGWRDAEHDAANWLQRRGEANVRVGLGRHDGGVDVESDTSVVQVKHWAGNVGAPAVQQIAGVAAARRKHAIVVARTGFSPDAIRFAKSAGVELYVAGKDYRRVC